MQMQVDKNTRDNLLQANCCEMYDTRAGQWLGCEESSNLYQCPGERPVAACCFLE
jgi:hypothetical protein